MSFTPPRSYQQLISLGLVDQGEFWYDVEWCPAIRWVDDDPDRFKNIRDQPIEEYYMFAKTGGGNGWCWHAGRPTEGGEYEVHETDLYYYAPEAPTFASFLFRRHLKGLINCESVGDLDFLFRENPPIIRAIFPQPFVDEIAQVEKAVRRSLEDGRPNPFQWKDHLRILSKYIDARFLRE